MRSLTVLLIIVSQAFISQAVAQSPGRDTFPAGAPRFNLRLDLLNAVLLSLRIGGEYALTPRNSIVVDGAHSYLKSRANAAGSRSFAEVTGKHVVVAYRTYLPTTRPLSSRINPNLFGLFWSAGVAYYNTSFFVKRDFPPGGYYNYKVHRAGILGGGGYQLAFRKKWGLEFHASIGPALQFYKTAGPDFYRKAGPGLGLLVTPFHRRIGWVLESGVHLTYAL